MPEPGQRWARTRFAASPERLAPALIGHLLIRRVGDDLLAGRIVETEAYLGVRDRAAHTFGGRRTPRNEAMYGPPGTAYVYFTYGMHFCFNIVCGRLNEPVAVLIRAVEPMLGLEYIRRMRTRASRARREIPDAGLCSGPAKLCQALAIDRDLNGLDLVTDDRLWVADGPGSEKKVARTPRIGVGYAGVWARRRLRWVEQ